MIEKILAKQLGISEDAIKDESNFMEDLGADSLDIVELVMSIEEEFDIEITDEEAETINTVKDLKEHIEAYS